MGTVPSMAVSSGTNYSDSSWYDILGKTRLAAEWKDHLYGNYILSAGFGVYLCEYSIWTLCGAMTQDIDERAKINTSRSVAAMIAIGVLNIITVPLLSKFGSHSAKTGYLTVAVIYGCIFTACHFFCFAKTKEAVTLRKKKKFL